MYIYKKTQIREKKLKDDDNDDDDVDKINSDKSGCEWDRVEIVFKIS